MAQTEGDLLCSFLRALASLPEIEEVFIGTQRHGAAEIFIFNSL